MYWTVLLCFVALASCQQNTTWFGEVESLMGQMTSVLQKHHIQDMANEKQKQAMDLAVKGLKSTVIALKASDGDIQLKTQENKAAIDMLEGKVNNSLKGMEKQLKATDEKTKTFVEAKAMQIKADGANENSKVYANFTQQLTKMCKELQIEINNNRAKITKLETENKQLRSQTSAKTSENANKVNSLTASVDMLSKDTRTLKTQVLSPMWPEGKYCILSNGACPAGFTKMYGAMLALKQFRVNIVYLKSQKFGDSHIRCHRTDCSDGWSELHISTCCK